MSTATTSIPQFPFHRTDTFQPPPENLKLREADPVSRVELYDGTRAWIVMRHEDVCKVLASEKLSADRRHPGYPEIHEAGHKAKSARPTFVNLDDPAHERQRNMLQDAFSLETVNKLRPTIQAVIDRNIDRLIEKGRQSQPVDLMENLANSIPSEIIFKMLGIPDDEVEELARDSEIRHSTSRNAAETSNQNLQTRMHNLVDARITHPRDDLISELVEKQLKPGNVTKDDVVNLGFLVLTAGNAALLNSIGLGAITLLSHPSQLAEFKKDPTIAPNVVNELLRYNTTSALNSRRTTTEEMTIGDKHIPKNTGVICSVQSADRDRIDVDESDPESFDIHRQRDPAKVLGFGYGPHRCQGEILSRVELEMVFTSLFQRLPNLRLGKSTDELDYSSPEQNVGVLELPVFLS
ncbi:hypothetical protein E8E14_004067 [Neopestalotiopsis sp. 37M]|nr:hypothetical protein E8E14_004067 [Neopestalotiopsis sp. 37M]